MKIHLLLDPQLKVSVLNTEGYAEDSRIDKSIKLYEAFQSNDVVASSCSVAI